MMVQDQKLLMKQNYSLFYQPEYFDKWMPFFDFIEAKVKETNPGQSFWGGGSTWTGLIRFREYMVGEDTLANSQIIQILFVSLRWQMKILPSQVLQRKLRWCLLVGMTIQNLLVNH